MRRSARKAAKALSGRTSFVGRTEELVALAARFAAGDRLVTVLGPPGAGKTRLAERFAATWAGEVVVCSLAGARRRDDVVRGAAEALGVGLTAETASEGESRIGFALADRGACLLLLDDVDQAAEALAPAVSAWLDAAPECSVLCTSRQRLAISGESCLSLSGLDREHARELFLDRARLVDAAPAEGDPAIDPLLARLDRLPLAIELAAARAGVLAPKQILAAIERRSDVLSATAADASPRHASMRAAIDLSWETLAPEAQRALARCSVFQGPFTLAAAAAVLGAHEDEVIAALDGLRARSFLRARSPGEGESEVSFELYTSIREHAAERLAAGGEAEDAEAAHARHYAGEGARLAAAIDGARPAEAASALARDFDQLLAVHRRMRAREPMLAAEAALAVAALVTIRGAFESERGIIDDAVRIADEAGDPRLAARARWTRGKLFAMRGLYGEARADFEASRAAASRAGDRVAEARAIYGLATTDRESGEDVARSIVRAEEALSLARAAGDAALAATCLGAAAAGAALAGDLETAIARHEETSALLRPQGRLRALAISLANQALAQELSGSFEEARVSNAEAVRLADEIGDEVLRGKIQWAVSRLAFDAGRAAEADATLAEIEALARHTGDREVSAQVLIERARRAVSTGDRDAARTSLAHAKALVATFESPRLRREIEATSALLDGARPALRADADGAWFERAGVGRVDLARRKSLRLIFARLLAARGEALAAQDLLEAGWPGERVHPESGAMRVWTAIRTLRRLGLAGVVVTRDGGYALDPAVSITLG